jgi:hypothetical protein
VSIVTRTCRRCGTTAEGELPRGWSLDGATHFLCQACTRENVRSIEAKLDEEWW